MPVTLTYPGVYIEEVPSGVRTITGVATSITAFIGRALRGPDRPAAARAELRRVRARLRRPVGREPDELRRPAVLPQRRQRRADLPRPQRRARRPRSRCPAGFDLVAASEGDWGERLRVRVDHDTRPLEPGEPPTRCST